MGLGLGCGPDVQLGDEAQTPEDIGKVVQFHLNNAREAAEVQKINLGLLMRSICLPCIKPPAINPKQSMHQAHHNHLPTYLSNNTISSSNSSGSSRLRHLPPSTPSIVLPGPNPLRLPHQPLSRRTIQILLPLPQLGNGTPLEIQAIHARRALGPNRIRQTIPLDLGLAPGSKTHPVQIRAEHAPGPLHHGVPEIDDGAAGLRTHVHPVRLDGFVLARREDLQAAEDVEEDRDGADVGVPEEGGAPVAFGLGRVAEHAERGTGDAIEALEGGKCALGET